MRSIKHLLALAFFMGTLSVSAQSTKETLVVKTKVYCDHCQKCEFCGTRIYNHLMDVPGVRKVKVDDAEATISVTYVPEKTNPEAVRAAINAAGYDADDQPAPADAVAKLDGCCKKR